jgi:hypothetical protein
MKVRSIIIAAAMCVFGNAASAGTITFSDTEFDNANWTKNVPFAINGATSSDLSGGQVSTGGNPGPYLTSTTTLGGSAEALERFWALSGATYDPSAQGAVTSVSFSLDHRQFAGFNAGHQFGLGIRQGGRVFAVHSFANVLGSFGSWQTLALSALDETDFVVSYAGNTFSTTIDADFTSGGTMEFGIVVGLGNGGATNTVFTSGFDNFSVTLETVDQVPEPGSALVFGVGLIAGGIAWRRRTRRA